MTPQNLSSECDKKKKKIFIFKCNSDLVSVNHHIQKHKSFNHFVCNRRSKNCNLSQSTCKLGDNTVAYVYLAILLDVYMQVSAGILQNRCHFLQLFFAYTSSPGSCHTAHMYRNTSPFPTRWCKMNLPAY